MRRTYPKKVYNKTVTKKPKVICLSEKIVGKFINSRSFRCFSLIHNLKYHVFLLCYVVYGKCVYVVFCSKRIFYSSSVIMLKFRFRLLFCQTVCIVPNKYLMPGKFRISFVLQLTFLQLILMPFVKCFTPRLLFQY